MQKWFFDMLTSVVKKILLLSWPLDIFSKFAIFFAKKLPISLCRQIKIACVWTEPKGGGVLYLILNYNVQGLIPQMRKT